MNDLIVVNSYLGVKRITITVVIVIAFLYCPFGSSCDMAEEESKSNQYQGEVHVQVAIIGGKGIVILIIQPINIR